MLDTSASIDRQNTTNVLDGLALDGLDVLSRRIQLLVLAGLAGEEDETSFVGLEALDVGSQGLLGDGGAARVHGDTDGGRKLARDACFLCGKDLLVLNSVQEENLWLSIYPVYPRCHVSMLFILRLLPLLLSGISCGSYLQLGERETAASSSTSVVLDGRASHDGAELVHWTGSDTGCLCETVASTA